MSLALLITVALVHPQNQINNFNFLITLYLAVQIHTLLSILKKMFATKQDLLSLKEENLKLKENFKKFLKKHELNKKYITKDKVKEFMEEQENLIDNLNQQNDNMIVKDENQHNKGLPMYCTCI